MRWEDSLALQLVEFVATMVPWILGMTLTLMARSSSHGLVEEACDPLDAFVKTWTKFHFFSHKNLDEV